MQSTGMCRRKIKNMHLATPRMLIFAGVRWSILQLLLLVSLISRCCMQVTGGLSCLVFNVRFQL